MAVIPSISATPFMNGISSARQIRPAERADSAGKSFKANLEPGIDPIRPALAPGLGEKKPVSSITQDDTHQSEKPFSQEPQPSQTQSSDQNGEQLSSEEQAKVQDLKNRDREVKAHERAHQAAGGQYAGSAQYTYEKGPDGNRYAVGGEVPIDASPISGDPAATIDKMRTVMRAALAPAEPSAQDQRVAQKAQSTLLEAQGELSKQRAEEAKAMFENAESSQQSPQTANASQSQNETPLRPFTQAYQNTQNYGVANAFMGQIDPTTETNITV